MSSALVNQIAAPVLSSTAPPMMQAAATQRTSITATDIYFIEDHDTYEPGTQMQRAYQRTFQYAEDVNEREESLDALEFEGELDEAAYELEQERVEILL